MIVLPLNSLPFGAVIVTVLPTTVAVNPLVTLPEIVVALVVVETPLVMSTTVSAGTITMPLTLIAPSVAGKPLVWPVLPMVIVATAEAPTVDVE